MKTTKTSTLLAALALSSTLLLACGGDQPSGTPLSTTSAVSECGGFGATRGKSDNSTPAPTPYCDAEALRWSFDAATATLTLSDDRITLNCCGDHSLTVTDEGGVYVVRQVDAPEAAAGGARCGCMCVFDYKTSIKGVPAAPLAIEIIRDVTDDASGPQAVWSGTIDPTQGAGEVIIDPTSADPWCQK